MSFPLPERGLILLSHLHSRFSRDPFFFPKVARALLPGLSASASALLTFGVGSVTVVGGFPVHRGMFSSAPASNTNCLGCKRGHVALEPATGKRCPAVTCFSDSLNSMCRTTCQEHTDDVLDLMESVFLLEPQSSQLLNGSNQAAHLELLGK